MTEMVQQQQQEEQQEQMSTSSPSTTLFLSSNGVGPGITSYFSNRLTNDMVLKCIRFVTCSNFIIVGLYYAFSKLTD